MKNQNAKKEITRDQTFKIKMSKQEKEVIYKFAEDMGINPSRLARNILLEEANAKLRNKIAFKPVLQAYKKYLEVTKQFDILKKMQEE